MAALHRIVDTVWHKGLGRLTDRSPTPKEKTHTHTPAQAGARAEAGRKK